MDQRDKRQPPDFSQPHWLLESLSFYYSSRNRGIKYKKVFTEELADKKGRRMSDYTSDPFWFGIVSCYWDSDSRNHPERYKQFGFNGAKESPVISSNISIFGRPVARYLGFLGDEEKKGKSGTARFFCWFSDENEKWQLADVGDSLDFEYAYTKEGYLTRVVAKIVNFYGEVKASLEISNPRL